MLGVFLDRLTSRERARKSNRQLGGILSLVAGLRPGDTDLTGIVTDLGIELSRLLYPNRAVHRNSRHSSGWTVTGW